MDWAFIGFFKGGQTLLRQMGKRLAMAMGLVFVGGCAGIHSWWGGSRASEQRPIANPFSSPAGISGANPTSESVILRSKRGDQSVEVELPLTENQRVSEWTLPIKQPEWEKPRSPSLERGPASVESAPEESVAFSATDYEIQQQLRAPSEEIERQQHQVEQSLFLVEDRTSSGKLVPVSYLSEIDIVQKLYDQKQYGNAILKIDQLLKRFPSSALLFEKRGSLLFLLGEENLAIQSWKQALSLNPKKQSLRKFLERKEKQKKGTPS